MSNSGTRIAAFVDPTETYQSKFSTAFIFAIVAALGCSYAFNGMDRQVFPALLGPISKEYGLTLAEGGFLTNAFAVNIAIFGALSGWFMARFGRKATLVGGLIVYSAFTFITPLAHTYTELALYRSMTGAGEALHISAIFAMVGAYFGPRRGAFVGINNAFFGVGAFLGPFLGTRFFVSFGSWHHAFFIFGIAGLLTALTVLFLVPRGFAEAVDCEKPENGAVASSDRSVFNRNSVLCVLGFALVGYSFFAYAALYTTYLHTQLGFSITEAGTAFGMYGIGTLLALVCGWLGEKLKHYGLMVALLLLTAISYLLFHDTPSLVAQSALSFCYGALVSGYLYPRFISVGQRSVQPDQIGYAMSLLIPMFYLPGLFAGVIFGKLVDTIGWSWASSVSVVLPAVLGFVVMAFHAPKRMRGA
ncbi:MAG TPA: MFS transporter [Pseudolabrys sp.]|jgi:MFS family permease